MPCECKHLDAPFTWLAQNIHRVVQCACGEKKPPSGGFFHGHALSVACLRHLCRSRCLAGWRIGAASCLQRENQEKMPQRPDSAPWYAQDLARIAGWDIAMRSGMCNPALAAKLCTACAQTAENAQPPSCPGWQGVEWGGLGGLPRGVQAGEGGRCGMHGRGGAERPQKERAEKAQGCFFGLVISGARGWNRTGGALQARGEIVACFLVACAVRAVARACCAGQGFCDCGANSLGAGVWRPVWQGTVAWRFADWRVAGTAGGFALGFGDGP